MNKAREKSDQAPIFPDDLLQKVAILPMEPGVYLHKDKKGKVVYVGKAKNLRHRVRSYFQVGYSRDEKTQALVNRITNFDYIVTKSEQESLILEMNLIKHYRPHYNIQLKDDKSFPYIKVTLDEVYPRVFSTRIVEKDGAKYYGPYTSSKRLRDMLVTIKKLFPIRSCKEKLPFPEEKRPCLDYHIRKCEAPCKKYVTVEEYRAMIKSVCQFIEGKNDYVIKKLNALMRAASANFCFEEAAYIRDRIRAITQTIEQQRIVIADPFADWDALAYATDDDDACMVVMEVRNGRILGRSHYLFKGVKHESPELILGFGFHTHYAHATVLPDEIFLQNELEDHEDLSIWISEKKRGKLRISMPQRGEKLKLVKTARRNATLLLEEEKLKKMKMKERVPDILMELKRRLYLTKVPRTIEGFDNSNIQGTDPVSGMVAFRNGNPYKSGYRKFKIKTVVGPDDFASMREAVSRRYRRLLLEEEDMPDLILIDGGKGQLSAAIDALESIGVHDQDIIGLAKRLEEVFLPGRSESIMIPKSSSALKLLQRVRDEAHRFSLTFHQSLRGKRLIESALDKVPGIGPTKKFALLKTFRSVDNIRKATLEEIAEVKGFSVKSAEKLKAALNQ
ncbi:MAG: excinuclease ABC subunit C [Candidatus Cloacimonetes bacterium 4572_55]|nr:MAG: excinuclease ABC subunit C [Candidatus Cloacimonetes bacterium 4572_55]